MNNIIGTEILRLLHQTCQPQQRGQVVRISFMLDSQGSMRNSKEIIVHVQSCFKESTLWTLDVLYTNDDWTNASNNTQNFKVTYTLTTYNEGTTTLEDNWLASALPSSNWAPTRRQFCRTVFDCLVSTSQHLQGTNYGPNSLDSLRVVCLSLFGPLIPPPPEVLYFAMGQHPRLGAKSPVLSLDNALFRHISSQLPHSSSSSISSCGSVSDLINHMQKLGPILGF